MPYLRLINPNYHVILIHYPLGLLGVGLAIEILSFLWRGSSIRIAGRWMILLGALATVPAVTSGIFAKSDIFRKMNGSDASSWADLKSAANLSHEQWAMLNAHVLYSSIGSGVAVLAVILWLGGTDRWRRTFYWPALLLLLWAMSMMVVAAYHAGEMVYRTGVATMTEAQATPWPPKLPDTDSKLNFYVDPLQAHIIGAGFLFALSAGALGMSLRKTALAHEAAMAAAKPAVVDEGEIALAPAGPKTVVKPVPPITPAKPTPAARFWVVAVLLGLATAAGGWYLTADTDFFHFKMVYGEQIAVSHRMLAHLLLGGSLILLPILMTAVSRTRNRMVVWFLGLLMIAAVAAQIGVGVLLLYDNPNGPLMKFDPPGGPPDTGQPS